MEEAHASFQHLTQFESLQPFKKINADLYEYTFFLEGILTWHSRKSTGVN